MKLKEFFSSKNIEKILSFMKKDKKNKNNKISLVLLKKIGNTSYNCQFKKSQIRNFFYKQLIN